MPDRLYINFAFKMRNFALKPMSFVFQMMIFVYIMMSSAPPPPLLSTIAATHKVIFQWKNRGFLLRNPDFLLKNVDLIMKHRSARHKWRSGGSCRTRRRNRKSRLSRRRTLQVCVTFGHIVVNCLPLFQLIFGVFRQITSKRTWMCSTGR